jgi:hypothetical protein
VGNVFRLYFFIIASETMENPVELRRGLPAPGLEIGRCGGGMQSDFNISTDAQTIDALSPHTQRLRGTIKNHAAGKAPEP